MILGQSQSSQHKDEVVCHFILNFDREPWLSFLKQPPTSDSPRPVLVDEKNDGPRLGFRGEHVDDGVELRLLGRSLNLERNRSKGVSSIA